MELRLVLFIYICLVGSSPVQRSGYITVNPEKNGQLFYWLVESQSNPTVDPLVLWVSGGPGCSGELALFKENGPWTVNSSLILTDNIYSWNKIATVIWIDQPVGTGYSYADSDYVVEEKQVALDMHVFLQSFFALYPQYQRLEFFISGL
eukprot:TRINITY_DN3388_c0_g1_i13.p1 TRINITY_DN3388_c0_g1~~TRINITY_DN3388_c0_g1_i13.p1  ORF type:complete len:149 (+),score=31.11 TRINITY_DN3388_c0_g1_i13:72-518(+)